MRNGRSTAGHVVTDAALGALAGAAATAAMTPLTAYLQKKESSQAKAQEKRAGKGDPTVNVAQAAASVVGAQLPERAKPVAGQAVHWAFGILSGAALGALVGRTRKLPPGVGVAMGLFLFLAFDEGLLPALGLSGKPTEYPAETHRRGLAGHLVYGVVLDRGLAVLRKALGRGA